MKVFNPLPVYGLHSSGDERALENFHWFLQLLYVVFDRKVHFLRYACEKKAHLLR